MPESVLPATRQSGRCKQKTARLKQGGLFCEYPFYDHFFRQDLIFRRKGIIPLLRSYT
jgi:hypothetical protein